MAMLEILMILLLWSLAGAFFTGLFWEWEPQSARGEFIMIFLLGPAAWFTALGAFTDHIIQELIDS